MVLRSRLDGPRRVLLRLSSSCSWRFRTSSWRGSRCSASRHARSASRPRPTRDGGSHERPGAARCSRPPRQDSQLGIREEYRCPFSLSYLSSGEKTSSPGISATTTCIRVTTGDFQDHFHRNQRGPGDQGSGVQIPGRPSKASGRAAQQFARLRQEPRGTGAVGPRKARQRPGRWSSVIPVIRAVPLSGGDTFSCWYSCAATALRIEEDDQGTAPAAFSTACC